MHLRDVTSDDLDTRFQERGQERQVTGQTVNPGYDQRGVLCFTLLESGFELAAMTIRPLATLCLGVFSDHIPLTTIEMVVDDLALRLYAKAAVRANPENVVEWSRQWFTEKLAEQQAAAAAAGGGADAAAEGDAPPAES